MRTRRFRRSVVRAVLVGGALIAPLGACGTVDDPPPAADPDPTSPGASDPPSSTTASPSTHAGAQDVAACMLPEEAWVGVGIGFPRSPDRLRSVGTIRVAVLFADFPDAAATSTPEDTFALLDGTVEFLDAVSYGRLDVELVPHLEWLRMAEPSADYGEAIATFAGHRAWISEAVAAADPDVDFAGVDAVVVIANPDATAIAKGPTWLGGDFDDGTISADGAAISNGITSGADLLRWGYLWLPHELGHSLSFVDLYAFSGGTEGYTKPFSLMDDIASSAPEYLAWERWHAGWLDDDQILCLESGSTAELTPIEEPAGLKAVVVPVGPTRAVVVESRRAIGYDTALEREGAVVYVVDTSIESGSGPIEVVDDREPLGVDESVAVEGVTVTVTGAGEKSDTVSVAMDGP